MEPHNFLIKWQISHTLLAARLGVSDRALRTWTASSGAKTRTAPPEVVRVALNLLDKDWTYQGKQPGQIRLIDLIENVT
jgi:hypothetical protein